jgi:hypothetical protein
MSWKKYFRPTNNAGMPMSPSNDSSGGGYGGSYSRGGSWLPEVYAGSPNRLQRYISYDAMDRDHTISTALDTISEFGTQEEDYSGLPFTIEFNEDPSDTESKIINNALEKWCSLNKLNRRIFRIFRSTCKYGDQIFIRDPETYELYWVDPANVEKVLVNETQGNKIEAYFIKELAPKFGELTATNIAALHNRPYGSGQGYTGVIGSVNPTASNFLTGNINGVNQGVPVDAKHVIHISLSEGMDVAWPFGVSILEPVFKVFKQKELLEDSIIIYRVHRAPERRVFFIDVGNMPPHKARQYLEQVRYEVQQKRVPNVDSQGNPISDAAYDPMCLDLTTKIPLLDGRTLELNQLIDEYQGGKENWVYSTNPETGKVVPGNITWAGVTRQNAESIKLTFDNGKTLICTPDHKIPVLGKGFVEAKDLTINDPLISFETREKSLSKDKNRSYQQVYDHELNKWVFTHRMVAEFFYQLGKHQTFVFSEDFANADKTCVHHSDYDRYNNNPQNLQWMNINDHRLYHSFVKKEYWENISSDEAERIKDKIRTSLAKYREENPEEFLERYKNRDTSWIRRMKEEDPVKYAAWRKAHGEGRARYLQENPDALVELINQGTKVLKTNRAQNQKLVFSQQMLTRLVEIVKEHDSDRLETISLVNQDSAFMTLLKEANPLVEKSTQNVNNEKFTDSKLKRMYKKFGYKNWKDFKRKTAVYNHRIVSIEKVENRDVGTITVDFQEKWHDYHTFAIEAGIFIKNSMLEDYFFAQTSDGRGSKVDTLPGGDNLGQIDDLRYFKNELLRGLRVPSSYLPSGPEDGTAQYSDGKVGIAYIQEFRFAKYVQRLQRQLIDALDAEFKNFLKYRGVEVDSGNFNIAFTEPMNFSAYREMQLDAERANLFSSLEGADFLSKRFLLKRYLGLTDQEFKENEEMWREENPQSGQNDTSDISQGDLRGLDIMPDSTLGDDMGGDLDLDEFEPPEDFDPGAASDEIDTEEQS